VTDTQDAASRLFSRLFDDASLFPPAALPVADAVAAHRRHRGAWYAPMVGPFVCAAGDLAAVARHVAESDELELVLLAGDDVPGAVQTVERTPGLTLAAVELSDVGPDLPTVVPEYVEVPIAEVNEARLTRLSDAGRRLKLRTGGTSPSAFPTEHELAAAIQNAIDVGLSFKCTAGLHHAVRHSDPRTGFEHHGFLNVLLAVSASLDGHDPEPALRCRDGAALAAEAAAIAPERLTAVRSSFVSFGTCSVDEPVADLIHLGLTSAP
jgi:hypothetical protein